MNWQLYQCFYAVAVAGSLSKASAAMNLSQPTLSRNIAKLEQQMGVDLFARASTGVVLTQFGTRLLADVEQMASAAERLHRLEGLDDSKLSGTVRISVNEIVGVYLMPSALAAFQRHFPDIQIEMVISNSASNLNKRDADMAFRMFRPQQPNLIMRRLPDMALGLYAHKEYLTQYAPISDLADLLHHRLIGFDQSSQFIDAANAMGWPLKTEHFCLRTDSLLTQVQLINQAAGIAVTHDGIAKLNNHWQAVLPQLPIPSMACYLVCHQDLQHNPRMRTLMDFLVDWFDAGYQYAMQG